MLRKMEKPEFGKNNHSEQLHNAALLMILLPEGKTAIFEREKVKIEVASLVVCKCGMLLAAAATYLT